MIHQHQENTVVLITFETGKGNSFSLSDIVELYNIIYSLKTIDVVHGVVLTGSNRTFSIGGDLESILKLSTDAEKSAFFTQMDKLLLLLFSFNKPLVVALNGHAIGLGFLITLCADRVVSVGSEKIKLGLPEIKIGMAIDAVMKEILTFNNIQGRQLANILYNGELMSILQATDLTLIDKIVEESELQQKAIEEVHKLNLTHPFAFQINKEIVKLDSITKMKSYILEDCCSIFIDLLNTIQTQTLLARK